MLSLWKKVFVQARSQTLSTLSRSSENKDYGPQTSLMFLVFHVKISDFQLIVKASKSLG